MNYIILSEKSWNKRLVDELKGRFPNDDFTLIDKKEELNSDNVDRLKPRTIFIPHWSYIIPQDIYDRYECIVFHMTDLPFGRGGSPLQNLIVRGFKETVISALRVVKELDAGDIYLKRPLSLEGSAEEIFIRANNVIYEMIKEIIEFHPQPLPQTGDIVIFKRRKPSDSDMSHISEITQAYDHIRMLDAEGYPHAYIDNNGLRYYFSRVCKKADGTLQADVTIKKIE